MRIRPLLFVLVFVLLSGATPVHAALGIEPRRLPPATTQGAMDTVDAKLPIPEIRQAVSNYDSKERDYLIRTIAFEAADESDEGKAAVAHVILNRKRSGRWGDDIKDVVTRPWQFEPWMTRRTEMERLSFDDRRYQDAARIADAVLTGQMSDPTAGATHFLNPTVVRQRRGGSLPSWARGEGQPIGRHTFYYPNEGSAAPGRADLSMGELADPLRFDTSSQPLTRADCGKAGMLWNEGANVCTDSTSTAELSLDLILPLKAAKARVTTTGGGVPATWAIPDPSLPRVANRWPLCTSPRLRQWRALPRWRRPRHPFPPSPRPPSRRRPTGRTSLRRRHPPSRSMSRAAGRVVGLYQPGRLRRAR